MEFNQVFQLQSEIPELIKQIVVHQVSLTLLVYFWLDLSLLVPHLDFLGLGEAFLFARLCYYYARLGWVERNLKVFIIKS